MNDNYYDNMVDNISLTLKHGQMIGKKKKIYSEKVRNNKNEDGTKKKFEKKDKT